MTFSVNTAALAGLPSSLDRRATDLGRGVTYLTTNTVLRDGAGLANVLGVHQAVIAGIKAFLQDVVSAYPVSDAARIRAVITAYRHSDARASARADAAVPQLLVKVPPTPAITAAQRRLGPSIFDDHAMPAASLVPPGDHYADMPYQPSWFDLLSPTSLARDAIWKLSGVAARLGVIDRAYDPFEMLVEPFVGDWAGLLRCAEVFTNLSTMLTSSAGCVLDARNAMSLVWTGTVAGLATVNLSDFAIMQTSADPPLLSTATAYRQVAHGVQDNANLLETIITTLVDQALDGVMDAASFGLLEVYDVGVKVRDFAKTLMAALRVAGHAIDLVTSGFAASNDAVNRLGILRHTPAMPDMPFLAPQIPWPAPANSKKRVPVPHV